MEVSLLDTEPCPEQFQGIAPLRVSLNGVKKKFESILSSEGFSSSDIIVATLRFSADPSTPDDHCSVCHATVQGREGDPVECTVGYLSNKYVQQLAPERCLRLRRGRA